MTAGEWTIDFSRILVTTDLSDESTAAYAAAVSIAEKFSSSLTLVSVVDTSIQFGYSGIFEMPMVYLPDALSEVLKKVREEVSEHVALHFKGHEVTVDVRESTGPVHHALASYISKGGFDLVVMSSHGRSGLDRALMGSVAEQVLRHSSAPVLIVPSRKNKAQ